jgi:hypothetical protein
MAVKKIVFVLKERRWECPECVRFPLMVNAVGTPLRYIPWVAYAFEKEGAIKFITHSELPGGPNAMVNEGALRNLRQRNIQWRADELLTPENQRIPLLIADGDELAAECLLDPDFLHQAHHHMDSVRILVGTPCRGFMYATDSQERNEAPFSAFISEQYHLAQSDQISPLVHVVHHGELVEYIDDFVSVGANLAERGTGKQQP